MSGRWCDRCWMPVSECVCPVDDDGSDELPAAGVFTCPHMSISNVAGATCSTCGPLDAVA